jgi:hypothetical protein
MKPVSALLTKLVELSVRQICVNLFITNHLIIHLDQNKFILKIETARFSETSTKHYSEEKNII